MNSFCIQGVKVIFRFFCFLFVFGFYTTIFSFGQSIYWSDFINTSILNDELTNSSEESYGTAISQNDIHLGEIWSLDIPVSFEEGPKSIGLIKTEGEVNLAYMDLGIHFSDIGEGVISIFLFGELYDNLEADENDLLTISYDLDQGVVVKLNNLEAFTYEFIVEQTYKIAGILGVGSSFKRISYSTDHKEIFESSFDMITNKGSIEVSLPDDAPEGPYYYLIGKESYIDLVLLEQNVTEGSIWPTMESIMLTFKNSDKNYFFEDLNAGKYYVSVLNNELDVIEQDAIIVTPIIEVFSTSNMEKEGNLIVSGSDESYADLNGFITHETSTGIFGIEVFDIVNQQFFGFGYDSDVMSGIEDIKYGFVILEEEAIPIIEGELNYDLRTQIFKNTQLFIKCEQNQFEFFNGSNLITTFNIDESVISYMTEQNVKLNLKLGVLKSGIQLRPLDMRYESRLYNIKTFLSHLNCGDEFGSITVGINYSRLYNLNFYNFVLKDENNIQMTPAPPTDFQLIGYSVYNSLLPGTYTVTGFVAMTDYWGNSVNYPINMSVDLGYKAEWLDIDNNYIETPNGYSVKVDQGYDESIYLQARSRNQLEYDKEGWIEYTPVFGQDYWKQPFRFTNANLSANPSDNSSLEVHDDHLRHYKFTNNSSTFSVVPYSQQAGIILGFNKPIGTRIKLKFTTDVALPNYPYGKVLVYVNNILERSFPRSNNSLLMLPNSQKVGYGFENCISSFDCLQSDKNYTKLVEKLDGGYVQTKDQELKVFFEDDYSQLNTDYLSFKIYDFQRNEYTVNPDDFYKYDDNRNVLDLSSLNLQHKTFYTLEVTINKDVKHYLRFQYIE